MLPTAPLAVVADVCPAEIAQHQPLPFGASSARKHIGSTNSGELTDVSLIQVGLPCPLTLVHSPLPLLNVVLYSLWVYQVYLAILA
jgi:hypothetical protein